ncbi:MAG: NAD-dependent epimerase/dehydratase family protein [Planctomycetaceae bacterium]|jgi:threonine 3-dehydrogenase|nr:NAD-dependent epimerase/dehydratase family protein [Planctomycetaceae bacterium]
MKYLITGGAGNIACQLTHRLPLSSEILLTDIAEQPLSTPSENSRYQVSSICDAQAIAECIETFQPDIILHFASLLSGQSEADRKTAWHVNMQGTFSLLEAAVANHVNRVIFPSSLASFGSPLPEPLPEDYPQWPRGFYGFTKASVERMGFYYRESHGLDFRAVRLPIIISPHPSPGAASSYASNMFIETVLQRPVTLKVRPTSNPALMYIDDCLHAIDLFAHADRALLTRSSYNLFSCNPSASDIAETIEQHLPDCTIDYETDDEVADLIDSWPRQINDSSARNDWGWTPKFDLTQMTTHFIGLLADT